MLGHSINIMLSQEARKIRVEKQLIQAITTAKPFLKLHSDSYIKLAYANKQFDSSCGLPERPGEGRWDAYAKLNR